MSSSSKTPNDELVARLMDRAEHYGETDAGPLLLQAAQALSAAPTPGAMDQCCIDTLERAFWTIHRHRFAADGQRNPPGVAATTVDTFFGGIMRAKIVLLGMQEDARA